MTTFAERLKTIRKNLQVTQKQVALAIGTTEQNYQRYERGVQQPTLPVILSLTKFFDVPSAFLLGEAPFENWEALMEHEDAMDALRSCMASLLGVSEDWMSELSLSGFIQLFGAMFGKVEFDPDSRTLDVYPLLPLEAFKEAFQKASKDAEAFVRVHGSSLQ